MAKRPFPGVTRAPVRHGKVCWRMRATIRGRKLDAHLPGAFAFAGFRAACKAAISPPPAAPMTAGRCARFGHVITHHHGAVPFTALARSTRHAKGQRQDAVREPIGPEDLSDLLPHHVASMMDRKGGPDAANRLPRDLRPVTACARQEHGLRRADPPVSVDRCKTRKGGFHTWTAEQAGQFRRRGTVVPDPIAARRNFKSRPSLRKNHARGESPCPGSRQDRARRRSGAGPCRKCAGPFRPVGQKCHTRT